jgi:nitrate/nitrite transport system ATP-binding protein
MMVTHDVDEAVLLSDRIVMMTNGPAATIGEVLTVPTAARARATGGDGRGPGYLHCREAVLEFLYRKQATWRSQAA